MGRPRLDRVHRRDPRRRGARPERPAALALLRHEGRARRDGVGGGRPRHPAGAGAAQGPAAAGPHVPRRHLRGPDRRRRGPEGADREAAPVPRVARALLGPAAAPRQAAPRPRARSRDRAPAPGGLRLHRGGREDAHHAHGDRRHRADRVDGHRHAARGAVGEAAAALRLLQAALRAGDEPAGRRHPRGDHHGGRDRGRAGGEPPRARPRVLPPAVPADADAPQRGAREDPRLRRRPGVARAEDHHAAHPVPRERRRRGAPQGARGPALQGLRVHRGGLQHHRPLGPRPRRGRRADPVAPRGRGGAPPPHPRGDPDPHRPRPRVGRAARGPPLRAARRLRRVGGEPVPRLRDHPRPGEARAHPRPGGGGREEVREGGEQGDREGDLQDGDLDDPELPRRPGVRGDRAQPGLHRRVLHLDRDARRRRRDRRRREGGAAPQRARLPAEAAHRPHEPARRRPVQVPRDRRVPPLQPGDGPQAPVRLPDRELRALQGVHGARRQPGEEPVHAARPHGPRAGAEAGADRRGRAGRVDHAPLQDRRDELRLDLEGGARGARHRDEPDRRQVEHRRGRRGPRALPEASRTATRRTRPSSRSPRAASA